MVVNENVLLDPNSEALCPPVKLNVPLLPFPPHIWLHKHVVQSLRMQTHHNRGPYWPERIAYFTVVWKILSMYYGLKLEWTAVSVFRAASLLTLATKTGWSVKLRMVKHPKPFSYKLKVPKEGKGTICSISNNWAGRTTEISPNGFQISLKEVCYQ